MSQLFGDRADFAIEAGVEPALQPPSAVWGHMCVWCSGRQIGDIAKRHCGLYGVYSGFRELLPRIDDLWVDSFGGMDDFAIWNFLDGLLYGFDDRTIEQIRQDESVWGRFDFLTNWDESFDHWKAFLLCAPGGQVRVLCRSDDLHVCRFDTSRFSFITACEGFVSWFEEKERQLLGHSP